MEINVRKRNALDPCVLAQFAGSEQVFRHGLARKIVFTEGVKYVADAAGAYWLINEIALAQLFERVLIAEEFQVWDLKVSPDHSAILTCGDGNDRLVFSKPIAWTDFPEPQIRFFVCDGTILLPSEY